MDVLTSEQISEWEAYDKLDPIGSWRDDYRFAAFESLILNIVTTLYPAKGRTPKQVEPLDFMPNWDGSKRPVKKQSVEEMKSALLGIAEAVNKKLQREERLKATSTIPPRSLKRIPPNTQRNGSRNINSNVGGKYSGVSEGTASNAELPEKPTE